MIKRFLAVAFVLPCVGLTPLNILCDLVFFIVTGLSDIRRNGFWWMQIDDYLRNTK